jgi:hypothetical protein
MTVIQRVGVRKNLLRKRSPHVLTGVGFSGRIVCVGFSNHPRLAAALFKPLKGVNNE